VHSVKDGDLVTIPFLNYHPVFSQESPLELIWWLAGERDWLGDKSKDFMKGTPNSMTTQSASVRKRNRFKRVRMLPLVTLTNFHLPDSLKRDLPSVHLSTEGLPMKPIARLTPRTKLVQQFNGLMEELLKGDLNRNSFRRWEAEILLDIVTCDAEGPAMSQLLRRYQKAVQRQLARGSHLPMRFSEYLESTTKHARQGAA
jgi:hypothetical protein